MRFISFLFALLFMFNSIILFGQESLGMIQDNTNEALPSSYNFKEYVYTEPDDQGTCQGIENVSAQIEEVFMAQTHRHAIDHPFFFTIGHRPALLQLAVTGTGPAPDVTVEGILNGNSLGVLCLDGPEALENDIDLSIPNFEDYFSVTLPKNWIQDGLQLEIIAGTDSTVISSEELKIGPYTEMNLVMVNMDVMDYNGAEHQWPVFDNFLEEMASAIPASVVRFGIFPETLTFPEVIASNNTEQLVRLKSRCEMSANDISGDGSINSIATQFLTNIHRSTNDYLSTVYFGNTLNLSPGGWGGGKSFVSYDYTNIFIHELGHALSLPHWGGTYNNPNMGENNYNYPYGGEDDNGGGRGEAWNFIQDQYEFVSPSCQLDDSDNLGEERSDCMQRSNGCIESRSYGSGPWDGYGDFSALAIHRYLTGGAVETGQVEDRGELKNYQFRIQSGFPVMSLEEGERVYQRDPLQPQELTFYEQLEFPGEEQIEQEVYLIYGSAHESQTQANIVYRPVKFNGTLPPIIDPTDPETFTLLQTDQYQPHFYYTRDITLKLYYADGSVLHTLNPFHSFQRAPYSADFSIWRRDVCNFSLVVPADEDLLKVEVYKRPFCSRLEGDPIAGNINYEPHGITAENFMEDAVYLTEYEFGQTIVLGSNTIGDRVWHDENQNGIQDDGEDGIAGVSLVLWEDSDGDDIPDSQGFMGVQKTDENGYYNFSGLCSGNYLVFVWALDNWEEGQPLFGMVPTTPYEEDPNTDLQNDSHGRPGNIDWNLSPNAMVSGLITLTADGEPLDDGDREDDWFDYDPSGNMTIDVGFFVEGATVNKIDVSNNHFAKIYPNPSSDYFNLETSEFDGCTISIIGIDGTFHLQSVLQTKISKIDVTDLNSGIYIALIKNQPGNVIWSSRIVKFE